MKHSVLFVAVAMMAMAVPQGAKASETNAWLKNTDNDSVETQGASLPLPYLALRINEKYDSNGVFIGDTFYCGSNEVLTFSVEPYVPVRFFNGTYTVEQIPFNPPDTSFYLDYNAATDTNNPYKFKLSIAVDDEWAPYYVNIPFPFYFFGIQKTAFLLGDNGVVTFADSSLRSPYDRCPYATTTPLPWGNSTPNSPSCNSALMRDAIYGVYEDTFFGMAGSYLSGNQGVYYGIVGEYPCRKIICSWNGIPVYNNTAKRQTYQIVCYEGTNIIEVHVKRRNCCSSTNNGSGLIGIQNATGQPQYRSLEPGSSNYFVVDGSPAAFYPDGWNPRQVAGDVDSIAFRFTPQGVTSYYCKWYRIFDDGRDSVVLGTNQGDTNGYCYFSDYTSSQPTLTEAYVSPNGVSRYVVEMHFENPNLDWYVLRDTVTVLSQFPHQVTVNSSDNTMGTVTGSGTYLDSATATLCAFTHAGYAFNGWSNGTEDNPYSLMVVSDTVLTALFSAAGTASIHDTIWLTDTIGVHDTIWLTDTIVVHDTIYVQQDGIENVATSNIRLYPHDGQIVVEDVDGGLLPEVTVFDAVGRRMEQGFAGGAPTCQFAVPVSGVYLVKIGDLPARRIVVVR